MQNIIVVDDRETRLPKWAQEKLADARRRVESAERSANKARLATNPADTNTVIDPYADIPIGLPKNANVRFLLGDERRRSYVDVRVDGDAVHVMGGGMLAVMPKSGNVVDVRVNER